MNNGTACHTGDEGVEESCYRSSSVLPLSLTCVLINVGTGAEKPEAGTVWVGGFLHVAPLSLSEVTGIFEVKDTYQQRIRNMENEIVKEGEEMSRRWN